MHGVLNNKIMANRFPAQARGKLFDWTSPCFDKRRVNSRARLARFTFGRLGDFRIMLKSADHCLGCEGEGRFSR